MKKLKLALEDLTVDSFRTSGRLPGRGTVQGQSDGTGEGGSYDEICGSLSEFEVAAGRSEWTACLMNTCMRTCKPWVC